MMKMLILPLNAFSLAYFKILTKVVKNIFSGSRGFWRFGFHLTSCMETYNVFVVVSYVLNQVQNCFMDYDTSTDFPSAWREVRKPWGVSSCCLSLPVDPFLCLILNDFLSCVYYLRTSRKKKVLPGNFSNVLSHVKTRKLQRKNKHY